MKNEYYLLQNEAINVIFNCFENISNKRKIDRELCMALRILEKIKPQESCRSRECPDSPKRDACKRTGSVCFVNVE